MESRINGIPVSALVSCGCGCGANTNSPKSTFRPGHDQRWVGTMARAVIEAKLENDSLMERRLSQQIKYKSGALQGKVWLKVSKDWEAAMKKAKAKQARMQAAANEIGVESVKVGRWEYPAKMNDKGLLFRNTKRDGSGEWIRHGESKVA